MAKKKRSAKRKSAKRKPARAKAKLQARSKKGRSNTKKKPAGRKPTPKKKPTLRTASKNANSKKAPKNSPPPRQSSSPSPSRGFSQPVASAISSGLPSPTPVMAAAGLSTSSFNSGPLRNDATRKKRPRSFRRGSNMYDDFDTSRKELEDEYWAGESTESEFLDADEDAYEDEEDDEIDIDETPITRPGLANEEE